LTLQELIGRTERRFKAARLHYGHGTDNARDEAAFLVLRGLGLRFDRNLSLPVTDLQAKRVDSLAARRIRQRIPAAYLLKDLPVPRTVLDLCCGSACLAVLAARAFPRAQVIASDISPASLAVARKNVSRHRRIRLVRSDLFEKLDRRFDLIVTNPPYVPESQMRTLPAEYRHEPGLALGAGSDGLALVRRILAEAPVRLNPGGLLVCEIGDRRKALEAAYPRLPLEWPQDEVFIWRAARTGGASRT